MALIAVEGPCCAGKTTLSNALVSVVPGTVHLPCYADMAGGGSHLPRPVPTDAEEDNDALTLLLQLDQRRAGGLLPSAIAVADRSPHTFLGHRYGVEVACGVALVARAAARLAREDVRWPDVVLYLDIPHQHAYSRNNGRFPSDSIFMDAAYNAAFREHFVRLHADMPDRLIWLDATRRPAELVRMALKAFDAGGLRGD